MVVRAHRRARRLRHLLHALHASRAAAHAARDAAPADGGHRQKDRGRRDKLLPGLLCQHGLARRRRQHRGCRDCHRHGRPRRRLLDVGHRLPRLRDRLRREHTRPDLQVAARQRQIPRRPGLLHQERPAPARRGQALRLPDLCDVRPHLRIRAGQHDRAFSADGLRHRADLLRCLPLRADRSRHLRRHVAHREVHRIPRAHHGWHLPPDGLCHHRDPHRSGPRHVRPDPPRCILAAGSRWRRPRHGRHHGHQARPVLQRGRRGLRAKCRGNGRCLAPDRQGLVQSLQASTSTPGLSAPPRPSSFS